MVNLKKFLGFMLRRRVVNDSGKGGWPGLRVLPKVDNLIDVGIGHQGTRGLYQYFPSSRKIFIDPLVETKASVTEFLADPKNVFLEMGLSDSGGRQEIIVREPISQSGFHKKLRPDARKTNKRVVDIKTLDTVIAELDLSGSVGIKIDTEGHELSVIKGALNCLHTISFVVAELPIGGARFESSETFEEIVAFMSRNNFKVVAIRPSGDGTDHCDIAFLNKKVCS